MPLVILEGPDGSGKTTLANRLLKGTKEPTILVKRSGRPTKHETALKMSDWIWDQSRVWGLNIIADRHPLISDHIYSVAVRQETPIWPLDEVVKPLLDRTILVVYCRSIESRMFKNSHVENQMEGVHEAYHQLVNTYDSVMAWLRRSGVSVVNYDHIVDADAAAMIHLVREFFQGKWHGVDHNG